MASNLKEAILDTIIYSDLFDFPLTKTEVWSFLKHSSKVTRSNFESTIKDLNYRHISYNGKYYFLKNREPIVNLRKKRTKLSQYKIKKAKYAATILSFIPTIRFIGISGSLALSNSETHDDIDLFIITKTGFIWTTRLWCLITLSLFRLRSKQNPEEKSESICLNMFLEEKNLLIPSRSQDVYTAHEIAQLKPLINKNNTYEQFLTANVWITSFLPTIHIPQVTKKPAKPKLNPIRIFIENQSKKLQTSLLKKKQISWSHSGTILSFYKSNYRKHILDRFHRNKQLFRNLS